MGISLIAQENTRIPLEPQKPRPLAKIAPVEQRTITGEPARGKSDNFMKQIMENPATQAFLLQAFTSMLGQQGIAASLGQGMGAMGRFAAANAELARAREAEGQRRSSAAGRGGGGGGNVNEASSEAQAKFEEAYKEYFELFVKEYGAEPEEATREATKQAMAAAGMFDEIELLSSMTEQNGYTPEDQAAFLMRMRGGPQAASAFWASVEEQNRAAQELQKKARAMENPSIMPPDNNAPQNAMSGNERVADPNLADYLAPQVVLPPAPPTNMQVPSAGVNSIGQGALLPPPGSGIMTEQPRADLGPLELEILKKLGINP